ncbi:choice-of-anchor Q domain-containing protein [Cerasicoccus fimbriatus]|uniref:choice-of-anchor Q domain-containing protein n=1 Tax=Cerasicoccus fimbriatus TaxID=3014554 RepID=UPI0022B5171A|nr:choice-of-anchor Q domain-containing protein [Cerasicoccus sp. TK19100]
MTTGKPWGKAAKSVQAGDTVYVASGDYPELVAINASGREGAPIVFKSFEPRGAKVKGFKLGGDYITIEGFDISNDQDNAVGIDAGEAHRKTARQGCQMIDNYIHDISGDGIRVGEHGLAKGNLIQNVGRGIFVNSGSLVEGNEIDTLLPKMETKNGKERIKKTQYCFFNGDDIVFRNNYLHGTEEEHLIKGMGVCFFTTYDAWIYGPSHNILIEGNRCFNATHASEPSATAHKESSHFTFRNNLFVNTVFVGVYCQSVSDIVVENNTFVNCGAYPIWFQSKRETDGSVARNNIIAYFDRERVVKKHGWKAAESGIRNNLHPKQAVDTENNLFWQTLDRGYDTTSITADPLFVDPANHDYRLRPGSPAINAGVTIADIKTDLRGVARPEGGAYDIGCYEYTSAEDAR